MNLMLSLRSDEIILPEATRAALRSAFIAQAEAAFGPNGDHYPPPDGLPELRAALAAMVPWRRGEVLVTNSATEAVWLALKVARDLGATRLAVQVPCYFGVLRQAADLGFTVLPWGGVKELSSLDRPEAILLTSNFRSPDGRSLTQDEKLDVASVSSRWQALVIEDNPYDPLWFTAQPGGVPVEDGRSIYIGSLSKIASPRFRLGFLRASGELATQLRRQKITVNLSSPPDMQVVALAALTPDALERLRGEMRMRAETLGAEIRAQMGVETPAPEGGSYLCLPLSGADPRSFAAACAAEGLGIDTNERQFPDGKTRPWARLHLGAIRCDDIKAACQAMRRAATRTGGIL